MNKDNVKELYMNCTYIIIYIYLEYFALQIDRQTWLLVEEL